MRPDRGARGALALALLALLGAGCGDAPCARHSDCPTGLVCSATSACVAPPEDAGGDGGDGDGGTDGGVDAPTDAPADAAPDAPVDAPPDAPPDGGP